MLRIRKQQLEALSDVVGTTLGPKTIQQAEPARDNEMTVAVTTTGDAGGMQVIRDAQINALEDYSLEQFARSMDTHLRTGYPLQTEQLKPDALRALIFDGIKVSETFGVVDEADIKRYLELMLRRGVHFDRDCSWAAQILNDGSLSGTAKMNRIDEYELYDLDDAGSPMRSD